MARARVLLYTVQQLFSCTPLEYLRFAFFLPGWGHYPLVPHFRSTNKIILQRSINKLVLLYAWAIQGDSLVMF